MISLRFDHFAFGFLLLALDDAFDVYFGRGPSWISVGVSVGLFLLSAVLFLILPAPKD